MAAQFSDTLDRVSWAELAQVIERAPLGTRDPHELEKAFRNSTAICIAREGDKIIGAGRALSDGVWRTVLFDVVVLPEHQMQGIGKEIVRRLTQGAKSHVVMLYVAPGKEAFYDKLGFRKMKTAMALTPDPDAFYERGYIE